MPDYSSHCCCSSDESNNPQGIFFPFPFWGSVLFFFGLEFLPSVFFFEAEKILLCRSPAPVGTVRSPSPPPSGWPTGGVDCQEAKTGRTADPAGDGSRTARLDRCMSATDDGCKVAVVVYGLHCLHRKKCWRWRVEEGKDGLKRRAGVVKPAGVGRRSQRPDRKKNNENRVQRTDQSK